MEVPFIGKRADCLNKNACCLYFDGEYEKAGAMWSKAINTSNQHFYSCFNLGLKQFINGEVSAN